MNTITITRRSSAYAPINVKTSCRNPVALTPRFMTTPMHIDSLDHDDLPNPDLTGEQANAVIKRMIAAGNGHPRYENDSNQDALILASGFGCTVCTGGLYATLGVLLAAAIATGAAEITAVAATTIAAATGLAEATVISALSGAGFASVGTATDALCKAMGAC